MFLSDLPHYFTNGRPARFILSITAVSLVFMSACGTDETSDSGSQNASIGSPPSVSGKNTDSAQIVELTEEQADEMDVSLHTTARENQVYSIELPGRVRPAPQGMASVGTPVEGRVADIYVRQGEAVEAGQALVRLESRTFAELTAGFMEAVAERRYLLQQSERLRNLVEERVSPERELQRVSADLTRAEARLQAARTRLLAVGIPSHTIDRWESGGNVSADEDGGKAFLTLHAPISGRINEYSVQKGAFVDAGAFMMNIINPEMMLVEGFASPEDLPDLRPGAEVEVHPQHVEGGDTSRRLAAGQISGIQPAMDARENAVIINSLIQSGTTGLVIGQSVKVSYRAETSEAVLSVPSSAVFYDGAEAFVFVRQQSRRYEKRRIIIQQQLPEQYIVARGLTPGEQVAASQIFSLKALAKFEDFAED